MTSLAEEVRSGLAGGWAFTPLNGKSPILKGWQSAPKPHLSICLDWIARGFNLGLRTGLISGVAVIDIEADAVERVQEFPETVTAFTGGGGYHLYYKVDRPVRNSVRKALGDGVDIRGDGGQVVYVGSVHPETGRPYRWMVFKSPDRMPMAPFPYHLLPEPPKPAPQAMTRTAHGNTYARRALANACQRIAATAEGSRHQTLLSQAADLGSMVWAGWLSEADAIDALTGAGLQSGLDQRDAERAAVDGVRFGAEHPTEYVKAKVLSERAQRKRLPTLEEIASY